VCLYICLIVYVYACVCRSVCVSPPDSFRHTKLRRSSCCLFVPLCIPPNFVKRLMKTDCSLCISPHLICLFSMLSVSYERKVACYFFPQRLILYSLPDPLPSTIQSKELVAMEGYHVRMKRMATPLKMKWLCWGHILRIFSIRV
jgi:hypothetical protein